MYSRFVFRALVFAGLALPITGCSNPSGLDSIQVSPATQALTVGQTVQFTAVGTYGNAKHLSTENVTSGVTWSSSSSSVATVSSSGVATALGAGTATITASAAGFAGAVTSTATLTVAASTGTGTTPTEPLTSLTIIPSSITVGNLQDTGQFLAIGTFSTAPFVRDLTNSSTLTWISSAPSVFPVNTNTAGNLGATAGIVSAYGTGSATIIAEAKSSDGTIQTATAVFNCPLVLPTATAAGSCYPGSQAAALLATLTVYNEGLNNTGWLVTAPSATAIPNVLDCGPGASGGSVCTATYPVGTTITLTTVTSQTASPAVSFGGWSSNCSASYLNPKAPPTTLSGTVAYGTNYCTVTLQTNDTVGAIFN
jgi:hypothetical protein